jgi:hypothetical protein
MGHATVLVLYQLTKVPVATNVQISFKQEFQSRALKVIFKDAKLFLTMESEYRKVYVIHLESYNFFRVFQVDYIICFKSSCLKSICGLLYLYCCRRSLRKLS